MIVARDQFMSWAMISARGSSWLQPANGGVRYSFFQARNAIYHSVSLLGIERGARILVPSYLCRAAIDPLFAYGLNVDFYAVKRDCTINLVDLERRITAATRAMVIVHYFGFPQPIGQLRKLCDDHKIALIEDCAHVLSGEVEGRSLGTVGDAAVFSWRKFLPVYDGGELIINRKVAPTRMSWTNESGLFSLKVAANMLDARLVGARQPALKVFYGGVRAGELLYRKFSGRLRESPMMQAEASSIDFSVQNVNWPMSRLSRWTRNHSNIQRIVERRRRNYEMLLDGVAMVADIQPLFSALPPSVCPWVFPALLNGLTGAHTLLRRKGIPACTWGGVRHPRTLGDSFGDSDFLYENLVFLPVHQSLREQDIVNITRAVTALYERKGR